MCALVETVYRLIEMLQSGTNAAFQAQQILLRLLMKHRHLLPTFFEFILVGKFIGALGACGGQRLQAVCKRRRHTAQTCQNEWDRLPPAHFSLQAKRSKFRRKAVVKSIESRQKPRPATLVRHVLAGRSSFGPKRASYEQPIHACALPLGVEVPQIFTLKPRLEPQKF